MKVVFLDPLGNDPLMHNLASIEEYHGDLGCMKHYEALEKGELIKGLQQSVQRRTEAQRRTQHAILRVHMLRQQREKQPKALPVFHLAGTGRRYTLRSLSPNWLTCRSHE